ARVGPKWGQLQRAESAGFTMEVAPPCPADVPGDRLPAVLAYWPAWRVTEWARLEIGSGVLIVGAGGLARQVAYLCQCRGTLWRGIWGTPNARDDGEVWFGVSGGQRPNDFLPALPRHPASLLMLEGGAHAIRASLGP